MTETDPTIRVLSLGAGVQSTTLLLLVAERRLPPLDAAVFADTGWEPRAVYEHLDRLETEIARPAGIPILRVTAGNIRDDALNPGHRFASMPLYMKGPCETCDRTGRVGDAPCETCKGTGEALGMARRQCTNEYKIAPIKTAVRNLLGYPHPQPVPAGTYCEQWVGISTDERHRQNPSDVRYAVNRYPLIEMGWSRKACLRFLATRGWGSTPKSACIGCPFHGNRAWRHLRDTAPGEWVDAVSFDASIRSRLARANAADRGLRGEMFLHRSRVPLSDAPIDRSTRSEKQADQFDIFDYVSEPTALESLYEEDDVPGCSPFACRVDGVAERAE